MMLFHAKAPASAEEAPLTPPDKRHHLGRIINRKDRRRRRSQESKEHKRRVRPHRFQSEINTQLKALCKEKSDWKGVMALATDVMWISGAISAAALSPWLYPLTALVVGTRMRGLATILHEGSHMTLCRSRRLNKVIGSVAGWSIFQTFQAYKSSHVEEHHKFLGEEDRDPDLINYINQGLFDTRPDELFTKHLLPLALGLKSFTNLKNLVKDRLWPKDWSALPRAGKMEYFGFVTFWALILSGLAASNLLWAFALFWMLPYLTVFQTSNWLIELSEHFPLIKLFDTELYVTRNRRGNWLENFFTGIHGENWHLVHHVHPGIPFSKLEEAHNIMMGDPSYATASTKSGGLFVKGPNGEPSIMSLMAEQLAEAQSQEAERK